MQIDILHGDCLEVMRNMPADSVDSIVTDPPAGIAFMNKQWDRDKGGRKEWISWMEGVASECLRVIKPGGHALVWSIPRTSHWTGMAWEDGGWQSRDKIYHCFGSGFPKSLDISKAIDKAAGAEREVVNSFWDGRTAPKGWINGSEDQRIIEITAPATPAAKQYDGWGTALKPAIEEWWLFRKPLTGTVAETVLQWGTGGLNIDGCRVETEDNRDRPSRTPNTIYGVGNGTNLTESKGDPQGRFPANLVHDGSDEIIALFPSKSGAFAPVKKGQNGTSRGVYGDFASKGDDGASFRGDTGSAARFFYCAKSSVSDREEGLAGLELRQRDTSRKEGNPGGDNPRNRGVKKKLNHHPTVKPTELMRYLCRLITPPGGIVLDPFCGSGSTGKGAVIEGFSFIGIDAEEEYIEIARSRIAYAKSKYESQHIQKSLGLFA